MKINISQKTLRVSVISTIFILSLFFNNYVQAIDSTEIPPPVPWYMIMIPDGAQRHASYFIGAEFYEEWKQESPQIAECEDVAQNTGGYCKEDYYLTYNSSTFEGVIYSCDDDGSGQCSDRCYGKNHSYYDDVDGTFLRTEWDCCPSGQAPNEYGQCVLYCPYGTLIGNSSQCTPEPLSEEELNRADEGVCTGNPVNIATGNKFFRITDYIDNSNPLLKITRTYDSADGIWVISSTLSLTYHANEDVYTLTFANGSKGSFVKQGTKWVRYETKIQEYLTKLTTGDVVHHGFANRKTTFNSAGQVIIEQQGSNKLDYSYATNGDITITDTIRQRSLSIAFDEQQKVANISLPNQKQITYFYDTQGRLASVNNQAKTTTYLYENTALPNAITKVIDTNGKTYKEIAYGADGRVNSSALNSGNELMTFEYPADNTTLTTNALGKQTTYNFVEIKGVKKISQVQGHATTSCLAANQNYEYYPDGQLLSKTDWKGIKTEFIYNERGLEIQRTEAVDMPEQRVITTTWHANLDLPESVTVGNQVTTYSYDANGMIISKRVSKI